MNAWRALLIAPLASSVLASAMPGAAQAQEATLAAAKSGVHALGKRFDGEVLTTTARLYTALQRRAPDGGVRVEHDVRYGPDALQAFDLYLPAQRPASPAPIVVFLHGGGLTQGDKTSAGTDGHLYGNIARFFARNGMIGVNANYRLVPGVQWPGGPDDIRAILIWLRENIGAHGGDPGQVFLMGNSAGATHVAAYLFHEPTQIGGEPGVAGALLSSGGFGAGNPETMRAYFGENEADWHAYSPLGLVETYAGTPVPIFMWSAEYDPGRIETRVAQMYTKLCEKYDDCPRFTQFQGHNHVSHVMSLNSADTAVGEAVLEFVHDVLSHSAARAH